MNHFNIEWHPFQEAGGPETWYADVLGYHVTIFPRPSRESGGPTRFTATYEQFGEQWHIGLAEGFATVDKAKRAVDAMLAQAVQDLRVDSSQAEPSQQAATLGQPPADSPAAHNKVVSLLVEKGLVTVKDGAVHSTSALREILNKKVT